MERDASSPQVNVKGDGNEIYNNCTINIYKMDIDVGMPRTGTSQTSSAPSGTSDSSHQGTSQTSSAATGTSNSSHQGTSQTSSAPSSASYLSSHQGNSQTSLAPSGTSLGTSQTSLAPSGTSLGTSQTSGAPIGASYQVSSHQGTSQTSLAPSGTSLGTFQTSRAPIGASSLSSHQVYNTHEPVIRDETKGNAEVKEIEISWLAKAVAENGRFCEKREILFRRLNILDQEIRRIKQERLDGRRVIEDEVFKVINIGWLEQPPIKTRNRLKKCLFTFDKALAHAYAEYINSSDDFDTGLPLQLPSSMNSISPPTTLPSIQEPPSLPSPQSPTDCTTVALSFLSIQEASSVDGGQVPFISHSNEVFNSDVTESEITWLSENVANGPHFRARNSLYRHLSIPDREVGRITYEKLGDDRNIENEIFKVVNEGWRSQGLNRTRALLCRQLLTFNRSLAGDYFKFVNDEFTNGNIASGY